MPDARLARARRSLPEGYQFGDAARVLVQRCPFCCKQMTWLPHWSSWGCYACYFIAMLHLGRRDQVRASRPLDPAITANVIEGERY